MSKSNTFENDLLKLIFNGTPIAGLADNAASSPIANFYVSLHTADPGEAGTQATNEVNYGTYARQLLSRTSSGFTVSGATVTFAINSIFGEVDASAGVVTHFAVGTALTGAGKILYYGTLTPEVTVVPGVIPGVSAATVITEN